MIINDTDLQSLLEKRASHIGQSWKKVIPNIIGDLGLLLSAVQLEASPFKYGMILLGAIVLIFDARELWQAMKNNYTVKNLQEEIQALDLASHKYSLIAIKDTFRRYPNRFLVYYDKGWDCYFLPNYKTRSKENEKAIIESLSHELKVDEAQIAVKKIASYAYQKISAEDHLKKNYEHTLYLADIQEFPITDQEEEFTIDGKHFKWMTIEAMKQDKQMQEKNMDVIKMLKDNIT